MEKINVAVVGLGMMGQMHLGCYCKNSRANVVAVCDSSAGKKSAKTKVAGNLINKNEFDLAGVTQTRNFGSLLQDPNIDLIDLCLPTRQHASATIAALSAGKHVLCEKPMAWSEAECDAVIEAARQSGKFLMIGHCLRFWPHYVRARELLDKGDLGAPLHARFSRFSGAPVWSRWLMDGAQSGGVVLDMHIHDIDTALWWFGPPDEVRAMGLIKDGLPLQVDAAWKYASGLQVQMQGGWDQSARLFRMGFEVVCENGTLFWDSGLGETLSVFRGAQEEKIRFEGAMGYESELDYILECIQTQSPPARVTPHSSRMSVKWAREELRQIGFEAG